ncbi:LacI family DNA-binding transcriptional regulator [Alicyclobacillus cycloheptanicus]|uniref:LacI family transcriptional regulator n=1 Tax=Alicyclobacillus cycloheptanicus TaxID=1457 RepID=A0ABT9XHV2_9BACL|nr:LacI family DNA-binding transcriptional regulator [Alicyclobacillus cycloheptanicus]MDQ0189895.1 LacI family transcriptional regulator [Alicyclobacillus cycloheptanicus]WDM02201.1 LacI family DNA-binding transcriptional regulator [Alicyclobacillus cycloheptanicus]
MKHESPGNEVTIREVGKRAGVSPATVGRVIGGYGKVSEPTRQRVLEAIRQLDYHPNTIAQSMKGKQRKSVGMIVSDICNPFFGMIARAVDDTLIKYGYNLVICNTDDGIDKEASYLKTLTEKRVDGVLACTACEVERKIPRPVRKFYLETPTVFIDREAEGIDVPVIQADNFGGAYEAVVHLIQLGHERIAIVAGGSMVSSIHQRLQGYMKALQDFGLQFRDDLVKLGRLLGVESGAYAARELLNMPAAERPTAIVGLNNLMTTGVLLAIREAGMTIPDDISVIGWDDFDLAQVLSPPLTVVTQPTYSIGSIAAEHLIALLERQRSYRQANDRKIILKTELVIRESCTSPKAPK